jgi:hypothetical protein
MVGFSENCRSGTAGEFAQPETEEAIPEIPQCIDENSPFRYVLSQDTKTLKSESNLFDCPIAIRIANLALEID